MSDARPSARETQQSAVVGLGALDQVELSPANQQRLELASQRCGGSAMWRARKKKEALDVFRLSELAPPNRLVVKHCDMRQTLRMTLRMDVPIMCRKPNGEFQVHRGGLFGLMYHEDVLRHPLPGYAFILILAPPAPWHANVLIDGPGQPLCLGRTLPVGIPCVELILATYGALTMQNTMIDERDPVGVFNTNAARWWQLNQDKIPLSRTPFLVKED
jgi:hypothetical protein